MADEHRAATPDERQRAVDENYEAFKRLLPELIKRQPGKFAVLRNQEVVEFFDTARDARIYAEKTFPDGLFSIQQIIDVIEDLGYFSHAVHIDPV